jgi:hypothetical protein
MKTMKECGNQDEASSYPLLPLSVNDSISRKEAEASRIKEKKAHTERGSQEKGKKEENWQKRTSRLPTQVVDYKGGKKNPVGMDCCLV